MLRSPVWSLEHSLLSAQNDLACHSFSYIWIIPLHLFGFCFRCYLLYEALSNLSHIQIGKEMDITNLVGISPGCSPEYCIYPNHDIILEFLFASQSLLSTQRSLRLGALLL